jgi:hypothetical protein
MQQPFRHLGRIHFWELRADRREIQAFFGPCHVYLAWGGKHPDQLMGTARLSCIARGVGIRMLCVCVSCPRPRPIDACHDARMYLALGPALYVVTRSFFFM